MYLGGESFAGIYIPNLAKVLFDEIDAGNLKVCDD
jgi:carboxypeptidase C (cathepsin A)